MFCKDKKKIAFELHINLATSNSFKTPPLHLCNRSDYFSEHNDYKQNFNGDK